MTEKMQVLLCLCVRGECTLLQLVDTTEIPSGRVFAALSALVREGSVARARRDRFDRYTATEAGRAQAETWQPAAPPAPAGVPRLRVVR